MNFLLSMLLLILVLTGRDGLSVVHIAAADNNINTLKPFENLGADLMFLGESSRRQLKLLFVMDITYRLLAAPRSQFRSS